MMRSRFKCFRGIAYAVAARWARCGFGRPLPSPALTGLLPSRKPIPTAWLAGALRGRVRLVTRGVFPRSEDCLYLNVWDASRSQDMQVSPCLSWCGFMAARITSGWGHHPLFDGSSFTDQKRDPRHGELSSWALGLSVRYPCWRQSRIAGICRQLWFAG